MRTLTENDPVIKNDGSLEKLGDLGGETYTLPKATASTLGGVKVGSGLSVTNDGTLSASGTSYTLPAATAETLGGIKVGSGLSVTEGGTLSAESYTLPAATAETLGGIKVGSGLSVTEDGTLSTSGGGGGTKYLHSITMTASGVAVNIPIINSSSDEMTQSDVSTFLTEIGASLTKPYACSGWYKSGTNTGLTLIGICYRTNIFSCMIGQEDTSYPITTTNIGNSFTVNDLVVSI